MLNENLTGFAEHRTPHYTFHYRPGSTAARDIALIAAEQESCFARITAALQVMPDFPLHYILLETAEEAGALYEQATGTSIGPLNGCAHLPDTITAVYNEDVKCIGMHEDTHVIAQLVGDPWQGFIIEGLAMYMDQTWWGEPNEAWVRRFLSDGRYVPLAQLMPNDSFYDVPCEISYPIAGAFTRYLAETLTLPVYLKKVYAADCDAEKPQCLPPCWANPWSRSRRTSSAGSPTSPI